jgi:PadR family transcriptional regulator, regulatory protein PadR
MRLMESSIRDIELTPAMAALLEIFLQDADRPRYGFDLMHLTGQRSGMFYRNLAALEQAGWLTSSTEHVDPSAEHRPPRRFYQITRPAVFKVFPKLAALRERVRRPALSEHIRRPLLIVEWSPSEFWAEAEHARNARNPRNPRND